MGKSILFLFTLSMAFAADASIIVETGNLLLDIQNMHTVANTSFNLVDETGGNTSSVLLVAATHRYEATKPLSDVTLTRGGSTAQADLFAASFHSSDSNANGISFYAFDLGNATAGESVTLNNLSTIGARETFTVLQISGARLSDALFTSGSRNGNTFSSSFASNLDAGSFTFWIAGNVSKRTLTSVTPEDPDNFGSDPNAAGSNYGVHWAYDGALSGATTVGFTIGGDGSTQLGAINLQPVPEPATHALLLGSMALGFIVLRRRRKN